MLLVRCTSKLAGWTCFVIGLQLSCAAGKKERRFNDLNDTFLCGMQLTFDQIEKGTGTFRIFIFLLFESHREIEGIKEKDVW